MTVTGNKEIDIEAPPAAVIEVLADVESLPSWSPVHKKVEVVDRYDDGKPRHVKMSVSVLGINDDQVVEYSWSETEVSWDLIEGSQQKSQRGEYILTPNDKGTHVAFSLSIDPKIPVPGFIVKKGTKTVLKAATEGLRQQVVG